MINYLNKSIIFVFVISLMNFSCGEKKDKLTILKEEMIGEDIKGIYGKKIILTGIKDFDNYHVYFTNQNFTVKANKDSGKIIDVCLGKRCFYQGY